ncbi:MAG: sulfite exporter TauE/SafE family protein [Faecalibacterium sp.]|nr:sulfite exporter TauE/SafE family protein [Faecalibacterium sp.]
MAVVLFFVVSFLASTVGAICGIGGGVIIKPVLDLCGLASVSTISFLANCTVLAMTCYSVGRNLLSGESKVDLKTGTPLAVGAAVGGVLGKQLFGMVKAMFENQNTVGAVQAVCLALITVGTFVYTLYKQKIPTRQVQGAVPCVVIGLLLGIMSSFLGIGGGPINLVVLFYFFSMQTKLAAQYSLYIILFSQITSIATTFVTGSVPQFELPALVLMVAGGIGGGIAGRSLNKKLDNKAVDKLFLLLMAVIIGISVFNTFKYAAL